MMKNFEVRKSNILIGNDLLLKTLIPHTSSLKKIGARGMENFHEISFIQVFFKSLLFARQCSVNGDVALNKRNICPGELPFHWRRQTANKMTP